LERVSKTVSAENTFKRQWILQTAHNYAWRTLQNVYGVRMFVHWELFNFKRDKETKFRAGLIKSDFKAHKPGKDEEIKTYILDSVFLAMYQNLRSEILIEKSMVAQTVNNPSIL